MGPDCSDLGPSTKFTVVTELFFSLICMCLLILSSRLLFLQSRSGVRLKNNLLSRTFFVVNLAILCLFIALPISVYERLTPEKFTVIEKSINGELVKTNKASSYLVIFSTLGVLLLAWGESNIAIVWLRISYIVDFARPRTLKR